MTKDKSNLFILIIFSVILSGVLFIYNNTLGLVGFAILIILSIYSLIREIRLQKKLDGEFKSITSDMDSAAKSAGANLPIPIVVISDTGNIRWYNNKFSDLLGEKEIYNIHISELLPGINLDLIENGFGQESVSMNDRIYDIKTERTDDNQKTLLYLNDITELSETTKKYNAERMAVVLLNIDNLEEVLSDVKDDKVPFVNSEIEKMITSWGINQGALVKKYAKDRYLVIFNYEKLYKMEEAKFSILDDIRSIDVGNKIPITLSMGIAYGSESPSALEQEAFACLELALGRGGDQAVLKKNGNYEFFGGKSKAVERKNKVRARVIAHGFRSLIDESNKVIVMGHRMPDMDAFGACMGVYRAAKLRNKPVYIISAEFTEAIDAVYDVFKDNPEYIFITPEEALKMVDDDTLLVVVDTHKSQIAESAELVDAIEKVVVIDHHRRSAEFIDKAVVKYIEPYASSASELVTEILQYMADRPNLTKDEADALLAGITLDTKNFSIMTGVRTFEAAGFLRKHGADTVRVRQLFQDDLEIFRLRASIVGAAEIVRNNIAVSVSNEQSDLIQLVVAQAADELLDIKGTSASFVIASKGENMTFISGRSLGEINVQVILEHIGGGGHFEVAGAQFTDKTPEEAHEILIDAIEWYYSQQTKKESE